MMLRKTPLQRRTPLRSKPKRLDRSEQRFIWKQPVSGFCQCGCHRFSMHLQRHHVTYEQHVRKERGDLWDLANSMLLHPRCHEQHHSGWHRIPVESIPSPALAFAVDLFGEDGAAVYLARYYGSEISWRQAA